jgi:hypothetical protein
LKLLEKTFQDIGIGEDLLNRTPTIAQEVIRPEKMESIKLKLL